MQILAHSLESCPCQQFFLTNSYETATQVVYPMVSLGPSTSTRNKMNLNFMRRMCIYTKISLGKAEKWIVMCCSCLDLQTLWIYVNMFSPVLYMKADSSSKGLLGIIHQKRKKKNELCLGPLRKLNTTFLVYLKMLELFLLNC